MGPGKFEYAGQVGSLKMQVRVNVQSWVWIPQDSSLEILVEFCISAWRKAFSDDLSLLLKPSMGRLRSTQVMEGDLLYSKSADLMLVTSF